MSFAETARDFPYPRSVVALTTTDINSIDSFANFDQNIEDLFITRSLGFASRRRIMRNLMP